MRLATAILAFSLGWLSLGLVACVAPARPPETALQTAGGDEAAMSALQQLRSALDRYIDVRDDELRWSPSAQTGMDSVVVNREALLETAQAMIEAASGVREACLALEETAQAEVLAGIIRRLESDAQGLRALEPQTEEMLDGVVEDRGALDLGEELEEVIALLAGALEAAFSAIAAGASSSASVARCLEASFVADRLWLDAAHQVEQADASARRNREPQSYGESFHGECNDPEMGEGNMDNFRSRAEQLLGEGRLEEALEQAQIALEIAEELFSDLTVPLGEGVQGILDAIESAQRLCLEEIAREEDELESRAGLVAGVEAIYWFGHSSEALESAEAILGEAEQAGSIDLLPVDRLRPALEAVRQSCTD